MAALPKPGTPLIGFKLGACSCLILTRDSTRPDESEELTLCSRPLESTGPEASPGREDQYTILGQRLREQRRESLQPDTGQSPADFCLDDEPAKDQTPLEPKQRSSTSGPAAAALEPKQRTPTSSPAVQVPALGPLGSGGWNIEEDVTEEMRQVKDEAVRLLELEQKTQIPQFHLDFLTSSTLVNYVEPSSPHHLVNALKRRMDVEEVLAGRKSIYLCGSLRVIGWDGEGVSILVQEFCTMRNRLSYCMDQVEYVGWTCMDLNKPGANGFICVHDFGGGCNPMHFLNPKPLVSLASMIEGQWRRRLKAAYLVGMPSSFERLMSFFLSLVKQSTRDKIFFLSTADQLLEQLRHMGCDNETITTCQSMMANRRQKEEPQTWFPMVDNSFFRARLADLGITHELQYWTLEHHNRLREAIQEFRLWRWGFPGRNKQPGHTAALPSPISVESSWSAVDVRTPERTPVLRSDAGSTPARVGCSSALALGVAEPPKVQVGGGTVGGERALPPPIDAAELAKGGAMGNERVPLPPSQVPPAVAEPATAGSRTVCQAKPSSFLRRVADCFVCRVCGC